MNAMLENPGLPPAERLDVQSGAVRLAVYRWGDANKPMLLFVHGYPDNHKVWLPLIARLLGRYQVVAYDVRGAGASDKPRRTRDYRLELLSQDLKAVLDAVSPERAVHLVAHDWGSIQTWESVTDPALRQRIASYTSISGPCLDHVGHWMRDRLRRRRPAALLQVLSSCCTPGTSTTSTCRCCRRCPGAWAPRACGRNTCARSRASATPGATRTRPATASTA